MHANHVDEPLQTNQHQNRSSRYKAIADDDGNEIRDVSSKNNQKESDELEYEVNDQKNKAVIAFPVLPPKINHEHHYQEIGENEARDDGFHVKHDCSSGEHLGCRKLERFTF